MIYLLPHIIEKGAEKYPSKTAFRFREQSLSYAELADRVYRLANTLRAQGVRRGDRVGIFMPKSLESAISIYGIMQAGAAYVPLDPHLPQARLDSILQDCEIRHLISEPGRQKKIQQISATRPLTCVIGLSLEAGSTVSLTWDQVNQASCAPVTVRLMEQDMAYLMYTSGSTGRPKGMIHTHASGLSYAKMAAEVYGLQSEDRLSNFPPLHFDQSTFDYFSGPLVGATTVIIPEEHTRFPASLSQLMADEKLTVWYSVPFALTQLLLHGVLDARDMSALRWVLFGGEVFPPKYLRALTNLWPQAQFSNVYGPAEVNQCTIYNISPLALEDDTVLPIGKIWPNAEGLVIDETDEIVEPGQIGELVVRTPTMMRGYWRRPDLNSRAFYHRHQPGGHCDTFYRTGDLVRTRPDGELVFLGRRDRQVKTRGYRVELDEVEAALLAHELVQETAVFPVEDENGSYQIRAAVIPLLDETLNASRLTRHLSARLPRYAIPVSIAFMSDFPRTASGKIDRRMLAAQAGSQKPMAAGRSHN